MNQDNEKLIYREEDCKTIGEWIDFNLKKRERNMTTEYPVIGRKCIVRTYSAGVHFGVVKWINPDRANECQLVEAYRLWSWDGYGLSLSALANHGLKKARINFTDEVMLTEAVEYIPYKQAFENSFGKFVEDED